jgi:hypothetical protein
MQGSSAGTEAKSPGPEEALESGTRWVKILHSEDTP